MYRITRGILMLTMTLAYVSSSFALPTAGCLDYEHCPAGYYCEVAVRLCRKCIQCEDLGRAPPSVDTCVKTIGECGGCLEGLAVNSANNKCGSAAAEEAREGEGEGEGGERQSPPPWWWWVVVAGGLVLVLLISIALVHVLKNFDTYKILACTTTQSSLQPQPAPSPAASVEASAPAPQAPPPSYNSVVALPAHPYEEALPFIKPVPSRDAGESQSAQVFNNPVYARTAQPPSYEIPNTPGSLSTIQEVSTDNSMDHNQSMNGAAVEEQEAVPNLPTAERPAKPIGACQWSNNKYNNNDDDDDTDPGAGTREESARSCAGGGGGTAFIINVIKNVNTVAQRNHLNT